jgi:hypothetical protein
MAESKKIYTDKGYYAQHEGNTSEIPSNFKGLGYYSRTSVEDIVNNFIIAYIGEDKAINKVPKYEVEFWAQRGVQEFSYDVLQSDKAIEIELGAALQFPLPQDYVNYTKITVTNTDGNQIALLPAQNVSNPTAFLQGSNHEFLYDNQDKVQLAEDSTTITRFQTADRDQVTASDYYNQDYNQENFSYYNNRFGSNPGSMNTSGTFFIDYAKGIIYFDSSLAGNSDNIITLHYIV